ncbi:MAG: hypothetical protein HC882_09535, partial [Acidobacteria bacterium]|nr:hypothetical protein [Acidobacteriota bacterium]
RFSAELDGDTPAGAREPIFVAPLGAALVRVTPGTPEWESTRLLAATGSPDWVSNVLARNRRGGWERVHLESRGSSVSVEIPWSEYSEAALIFVRPEYALGAGELLVRVEGSEGRAPFGLASFGGRAAGGDMVEISWETSWERDIFGWVIERAVEADGPWEFVEPIPAPALGIETRGGRYTIVDHTATAATGPLHYRLVALTRAGLRLTGPSIVVRH